MSQTIDTVSYDQYKNIQCLEESSVIFSAKEYDKLKELISKTNSINGETGCFFVGYSYNKNQKIIFVDSSTSIFETSSGIYYNGAVNPVAKNYEDLNVIIRNYKEKGLMPFVFHFHTHINLGYSESFSDQDLHCYAKMAYDNQTVQCLALLGFPKGTFTYGLSILSVHNAKLEQNEHCADFYRLPNIYYIRENNLFKTGVFQKKYNNRTTNVHSSNKIVRNSVDFNGNQQVCAIGKNPNTNLQIEDENIGYVDSNGTIYVGLGNDGLNKRL